MKHFGNCKHFKTCLEHHFRNKQTHNIPVRQNNAIILISQMDKLERSKVRSRSYLVLCFDILGD